MTMSVTTTCLICHEATPLYLQCMLPCFSYVYNYRITLLTTLVSVLPDIVGRIAVLTLMTALEWSVQETVLALMVWTLSRVFATMALKEKTALVGSVYAIP